ncbi:hypothetical protein [Xanthomonas phage JGB6]|nr:hypothetical protein [Xanthomonas phage JGB6]
MDEDIQKELDFLRWFYSYSDFGPADSDVRYHLKSRYERQGGVVPDGYKEEDEQY